MTILVGVPYEAGIVMGSDSQGSLTGEYSVKHLNRSKLREVNVRCYGNAIGKIVLAGAGGSAFISKAAESVTEQCGGSWFSSCREIADAAEDALLKVYKRHVLEKADKLGLSPSQRDMPNLGIMLAVSLARRDKENKVISSEHAIFTLSPDGIAQREEDYSTMGSGAPYAEYLLQRIYREKMPLMMALNLTIHAIEEAKKVDPYCGGPTRIAVLTRGVSVTLPDADIQGFVRDLSARDDNTKFLWRLALGDPVAPDELAENTKKLQASFPSISAALSTTNKLVEEEIKDRGTEPNPPPDKPNTD